MGLPLAGWFVRERNAPLWRRGAGRVTRALILPCAQSDEGRCQGTCNEHHLFSSLPAESPHQLIERGWVWVGNHDHTALTHHKNAEITRAKKESRIRHERGLESLRLCGMLAAAWQMVANRHAGTPPVKGTTALGVPAAVC